MSPRLLLRVFVLVTTGLGAPLMAAGFFTPVSSALSPRVAFDVTRQGDRLHLEIEADAFDREEPTLSIGIGADRPSTLSGKDGRRERSGRTVRWVFDLPEGSLMSGPQGWQALRFGLAVEWAGGPLGQPRQRERFRHRNPAASHDGLSKDPDDWQPLDLAERSRQAEDRALEIAIDFDQPLDGKATLAIDREDGVRVRNLVSGQPLEKGRRRIVWDGLDESGNVAPAGAYRWRAISHPGLSPVHVMDFCDAPGSNHGTMQAAATNGKSLFFGSPVAEGGWEIIELAPDGKFLRGFNPPHGHGLGRVALAVDGNFLYAAHDGLAWGEHVDRAKPDWKEQRTISVMRIDLARGAVAEFSAQVRHAPIRRYEAGPGSPAKMGLQDFALAGLALAEGRLFLADREAGQVHVIDPATGQLERSLPLADPVALASSERGLYAIAGGALLKLDPAAGKTTRVAALKGSPAGLCVAEDGRFYVSDSARQVVKVLDAKGREEREIGRAGGIAPGAYDPLKLQHPTGLVALAGAVWPAEQDRWQPKRLAAFDVKTGTVMKELFGPTNYGAQGAGFDDQEPQRWLGQGALWRLDFATGAATPQAITGGRSGRRHTFWRQDGRTFVITSSKATWIQELKADGTLRPLACVSSAHQFSFEHEWQPPESFVSAFHRDYPAVKYEGGPDRIVSGQPTHGYGMLWVDRNGNGAMDAEEIEFSTAASSLGGAGWSHDFHDLTLRIPAARAGKAVLVSLTPDGWWPGGAPRYPALNDAVRAAPEIDLPGSPMVESVTDRFGNTVLNSDPAMRAISPAGTLLWTYPNRWSNVHGSHQAPLPKTGELQGSLFYSGMAPLDEKSDVMLINGNHGRAFVMTSDGLYVDEMFPDVRLMTNPQAGGVGILGGECFGGTFGRAGAEGDFYFQGGGIAYRIYRIEGLRQAVRSEGELAVSGPQAIAAGRKQVREAAAATAASAPAAAEVPWGDKPGPLVRWERDGKFPVAVKAAHDGKVLRLQYEVADASPWVNHGKDWQALFKTGDGVDLQLGTDRAADPGRSGPVPGDLRLFIAPMDDENVVVLYRHRVPGANAAEAVNFQSPWRSEKVDSVRRLTDVEVAVQRSDDGYRLEVAIPLAELGAGDFGGLSLRGDFGVIYGDAAGTANLFRNYWSNRATGLVNDVPGEIMLTPNLWGALSFAPNPASR